MASSSSRVAKSVVEEVIAGRSTWKPGNFNSFRDWATRWTLDRWVLDKMFNIGEKWRWYWTFSLRE